MAHTRPRCEKKLEQFCQQEAIAAYLPVRSRKHRYGARERVFSSPVFPGYLFCVVDPGGMMTLRQDGMEKFKVGHTSLEEVLRETTIN